MRRVWSATRECTWIGERAGLDSDSHYMEAALRQGFDTAAPVNLPAQCSTSGWWSSPRTPPVLPPYGDFADTLPNDLTPNPSPNGEGSLAPPRSGRLGGVK